MIARELMNSDFPFVTVDADLDYVAKLLAECGLGVVPVVDHDRAPIGVVTRSNLEVPAKAAPELGDIPPFLLRNRVRPVFHANGRKLKDVMSTPAICATSGASAKDVVKLMDSRRLKRIPVVDGHRLVGVVLRKALIEAMNGNGAVAQDRPILTISPPQRDYCAVATAEAFRELVAAHERRADEERAALRENAKQLREQRIKELVARKLVDAQWREMISAARRSAEAGMREHMLMRFPSQLCADGGRAINAPDPHWPETLRGEPADVFARWRNELQPHGFRIAAQIVDFPDGMPGDAALFLQWGGGDAA